MPGIVIGIGLGSGRRTYTTMVVPPPWVDPDPPTDPPTEPPDIKIQFGLGNVWDKTNGRNLAELFQDLPAAVADGIKPTAGGPKPKAVPGVAAEFGAKTTVITFMSPVEAEMGNTLLKARNNGSGKSVTVKAPKSDGSSVMTDSTTGTTVAIPAGQELTRTRVGVTLYAEDAGSTKRLAVSVNGSTANSTIVPGGFTFEDLFLGNDGAADWLEAYIEEIATYDAVDDAVLAQLTKIYAGFGENYGGTYGGV